MWKCRQQGSSLQEESLWLQQSHAARGGSPGGWKGTDLEKGIQLILALWEGDTVRDRRCQEAEELEKVNFGSERAGMLCSA